MSLTQYDENNYDKVLEILNSKYTELKEDVFLWFMGTVNAEGVNWCPDCADAEPDVEKFLESIKPRLKKNIHIIAVRLDRTEFKSGELEFHKNKDIVLRKLPTIIRWKASERLELAECKSADLLEMLFETVL